jgi:hypothetical protein
LVFGVVIADVVLLFVIADEAAAILYVSVGQTFPFSVDFHKLAVIEILFDV